jgi:hypothetical protein
VIILLIYRWRRRKTSQLLPKAFRWWSCRHCVKVTVSELFYCYYWTWLVSVFLRTARWVDDYGNDCSPSHFADYQLCYLSSCTWLVPCQPLHPGRILASSPVKRKGARLERHHPRCALAPRPPPAMAISRIHAVQQAIDPGIHLGPWANLIEVPLTMYINSCSFYFDADAGPSNVCVNKVVQTH